MSHPHSRIRRWLLGLLALFGLIVAIAILTSGLDSFEIIARDIFQLGSSLESDTLGKQSLLPGPSPLLKPSPLPQPSPLPKPSPLLQPSPLPKPSTETYMRPNVFTKERDIAASNAQSLRIFVYEFSSSEIAKYVNASICSLSAIVCPYGEQNALIDLVRQSHYRTYDIAAADFFLVPYPLGPVGMKLGAARGCAKCVTWEKGLIKAMRQFGSYWDKYPHKHIVVGPVACPPQYLKFLSLRKLPQQSLLQLGFPQFAVSKAITLCSVGNLEGMDKIRSIHTGWYTGSQLYADDLQAQDPLSRHTLAMYAGSNPHLPSTSKLRYARHRAYLWEGLKSCSTCSLLETGKSGRNPNQTFFPRLKELLHGSRFNILPPGDSIERFSREQSIAMGAVPVYWGHYIERHTWQILPWNDILNWSTFSVNFTIMKPDDSLWPRLGKILRDLESSGEAARLTAGVAAVQARFRWNEQGVLLNLLESLAVRKLGLIPDEHITQEEIAYRERMR